MSRMSLRLILPILFQLSVRDGCGAVLSKDFTERYFIIPLWLAAAITLCAANGQCKGSSM